MSDTKSIRDALDDIPGTTVFDARSAARAYGLHQFCMSLMKAENRAAFKADEDAYLERFSMTADQRDAVRARDYTRMVALGGNVYFLVKIASTDGWSVRRAVSTMTDLSEQDFADMMLAGGRSPQGWRSRSERS